MNAPAAIIMSVMGFSILQAELALIFRRTEVRRLQAFELRLAGRILADVAAAEALGEIRRGPVAKSPGDGRFVSITR